MDYLLFTPYASPGAWHLSLILVFMSSDVIVILAVVSLGYSHRFLAVQNVCSKRNITLYH